MSDEWRKQTQMSVSKCQLLIRLKTLTSGVDELLSINWLITV